MAKKVTLADIAKVVGVSYVTVSKALAGKGGVSDDVREKIEKVAEEMQYTSLSVMKEKSWEKTNTIGVIIPERYYDYINSFYWQLYQKIIKDLYDYNYFGILEILTAKNEDEENLPKVVVDKKVDGLIILGQVQEKYSRLLINKAKLSVFYLDSYISGEGADSVISDGYYGMYELTSYLIHKGHKRIGFVGRVDATSSIADRYFGYRRALRENKILYQDAWEIIDRDEAGKTLQTIPVVDKMEAYVCNCDLTATVLIKSLESIGIGVPEDVSVVGFDGFLPDGMDQERITTYEVDMDRMADVCVDSLLKKINGRHYVKGIQTVKGVIRYRDTVEKR